MSLYLRDHLLDHLRFQVTHAAPVAEWTFLWAMTIARPAIETAHARSA